MPSNLRVESKKKGKALVVALKGDAGMAFVGLLQQELSRVCEAKSELVVLDMSELSFMSSMGMGTLVNFRKGVEKCGGSVKIAALQPLLAEAFRRARLTEIFEIVESVDAALGKKKPDAAGTDPDRGPEKPQPTKKAK